MKSRCERIDYPKSFNLYIFFHGVFIYGEGIGCITIYDVPILSTTLIYAIREANVIFLHFGNHPFLICLYFWIFVLLIF